MALYDPQALYSVKQPNYSPGITLQSGPYTLDKARDKLSDAAIGSQIVYDPTGDVYQQKRIDWFEPLTYETTVGTKEFSIPDNAVMVLLYPKSNDLGIAGEIVLEDKGIYPDVSIVLFELNRDGSFNEFAEPTTKTVDIDHFRRFLNELDTDIQTNIEEYALTYKQKNNEAAALRRNELASSSNITQVYVNEKTNAWLSSMNITLPHYLEDQVVGNARDTALVNTRIRLDENYQKTDKAMQPYVFEHIIPFGWDIHFNGMGDHIIEDDFDKCLKAHPIAAEFDSTTQIDLWFIIANEGISAELVELVQTKNTEAISEYCDDVINGDCDCFGTEYTLNDIDIDWDTQEEANEELASWVNKSAHFGELLQLYEPERYQELKDNGLLAESSLAESCASAELAASKPEAEQFVELNEKNATEGKDVI